MCRYVLATPHSPADKGHRLRLVFGNGLRPQIWPQFVERFNIPNIAEFYGATEGNANIGKVSLTRLTKTLNCPFYKICYNVNFYIFQLTLTTQLEQLGLFHV